MKPAPFEFYAPRSVDEVLALLSEFGEDARILAGGQSLVPLMSFRMLQPRAIISINDCEELSFIRLEGNSISCGALTRQAEAERSSLINEHCGLLARALPYVGGIANRNRGTVCGSLAHADPLAELVAVAVALDAIFCIGSANGLRQVPASAFFISELTTCIGPGEMLQLVRFPLRPNTARSAFVEVSNRRHGFAVVGIAAQLELDTANVCHGARFAVIGAGQIACRLHRVEQLFVGQQITTEIVREAADMAESLVDPASDIHADSEYRRQLTGVLLARAVEQCAKHDAHYRSV